MNLEKNFVKCVCIKVCDLLMYKWQQIGNRKSASQNNICNRDKITAEKSAIGELPKSKLSKAFHYALNNREGFWN